MKYIESLAVFFDPSLRYRARSTHVWTSMPFDEPWFIENLKRRFILSAEPQIGKTGTYLRLIKLFCDMPKWKLLLNTDKEYYELLQKLTSIPLADLYQKLNSNNEAQIRTLWERFHSLHQERLQHLPNNPGRQFNPVLRVAEFIKTMLDRERRVIIDDHKFENVL